MKPSMGFLLVLAFALLVRCTKEGPVHVSLIPNGDFESWTSNTLNGWTTNSCPMCVPMIETYIVQKDSPGYHGGYAARFIDNNQYAAYAQNKFALKAHPSALVGYFKCKMNGADTVSVKIWLYKNGFAVDSGSWINMVTIPDYSRLKLSISQSSLLIDTVIIRITGGHSQGNLLTNTVFWADYLDLE